MTAKPTAQAAVTGLSRPIRCAECGDEDGPFAGTPENARCENHVDSPAEAGETTS